MDAAITQRFSQDLLSVLKDVGDEGRFGGRKVFLKHAYVALEISRGEVPTHYGLDAFKKICVAAQQNGHLQLARLDLMPALSAEKKEACQASEIRYLNAEFHTIIDPRFA